MTTSVAQPRLILLPLVLLLLFLMNHKWVRPPIKRLQSAKRSVVINTFRNPSDPMCIDQPPPAIKEATDGIHYDVTLCLNDAWNEIITTHWLHTLPPGVKAVYPELAPQIFFHGRDTDPFDDLERDGYLHDSGGFHSLWTVGTFGLCSMIKLTGGLVTNNYLVVFKLKNVSGRREGITFQEIGYSVPGALKREKRIIARVWEVGGYPDAYVFTKEAQKQENNPLEIIRVYRYHLDIPSDFWSGIPPTI